MSSSRSSVRIVLCAFLAFLSSSPALAAPAKPTGADVLLTAAPFSLTPRDLLALRSPNAPAGLDVEMLLDDTRVVFDESGKRKTTYHVVYRVLSERAVADWASIGASYQPWYQNRPNIRARVVTSEGGAFELDPKTLTDAQAGEQGEGTMYSDRRKLSAPLPAVRVGSVVEWTLELSEHRPLFAAGTLERTAIYANTYTGLSRVLVTSPESLKLRQSLIGSREKISIEKANGLITASVVVRDVKPHRKWPVATDPALPVMPMLEYGTARSWADVAKAYSEAVDAELASFDAKAIVARETAGETVPKKKLDRLLAYLHREVRYTGLELGERSIIPASPKDTLARHYGDCKDKATLLVGLLRAAGFDAHVALLKTGPGLDVPSALSGMGLFDHAIVRVGGKDNLWIDATAEHAAPSELPYGDQDRLALVASEKTKTLERTPRTRAAVSSSTEDVFIQFAELGEATVREVTTGTGTLEAELRGAFDKDDAGLKEQLASYAKQRYGAEVKRAHAEATHDPSARFSLTLETGAAEHYQTYDDGGYVEVPPNALYAQLPEALYETPRDKRSQEELAEDSPDPRYQEPMTVPVYLTRAHTTRVNYHLSLPDGFRFHTLPDPVEREVEGIRVSRKITQKGPREVLLAYEVRTDAIKVQAVNVEKVRTLLDDFRNESTAVRFVSEPREALEQKDFGRAMALHKELLARHPKSVPVRSRYAQDLLHAGLGVAARRVATDLVKAEPGSARAHWTLAYTYLHDEAGRDSYPGADFEKAETALRAALKAAPDEAQYYAPLARVLTQLALERRPIDAKRLSEATGLFEKRRTRFDLHDTDQELLSNYVWREKYAEAVKLGDEMENASDRNSLLVAAVAGREGAQGALRKAQQIAGNQAKQVLVMSASVFSIMGRYELAASLLKLPGVREQNIASALSIEAANNRAACEKQLAPAARALIDFERGFVADGVRFDRRAATLEKLPEARLDRAVWTSFFHGLGSAFDSLTRGSRSVSMPLVGDSLACRYRWEVEEKNGAVRLKSHDASAARSAEPATYYLRKEKNGYAVLGLKDGARTVAFSRAMYAALDEKKLDEAKQWAEWAHQLLAPFGGHRERYTFADGEKALYPKDLKTASADDLTLYAAYLAGTEGVKDRELKRLEADEKRLAGDADKLRAIRYGITFHSFAPERFARGAALLDELHAAFPEDLDLARRRFEFLYRTKQDERLLGELVTFEQKQPDDEGVVLLRGRVEQRAGRFGELLTRTEARLKKHEAHQRELNNVAWLALFTEGADLKRAQKLADAACDPETHATSSALHTLATLAAERGELGIAQAKLRVAMEKRGREDVSDPEWLTLGMLAERAGLSDVARDAYQRLQKPAFVDEDASWLLAQARLKALKP